MDNKYYSKKKKTNKGYAVNEAGKNEIIRLRGLGYTYMDIERETGIPNRTATTVYLRYLAKDNKETRPDLKSIEKPGFHFFEMR